MVEEGLDARTFEEKPRNLDPERVDRDRGRG
jgi:hypothetical protein